MYSFRNLPSVFSFSGFMQGRAFGGTLPFLFFLYCVTVLVLCHHSPTFAAEKNTNTLTALVQEYEALGKDAKKGGMRHNWISLSKKFTQASSGRGPAGDRARASYYAARSMHSLGQRSGSGADFRQAVSLYEKTALTFPASPHSGESLLAAAQISAERLKDAARAMEYADRAIEAAPGSLVASDAQKLKARLAATGVAAGRGTSPKKPVSTLEQRAEQLGLTVKTIMLDAGHGGKDPGAEANGISERDITLKFAKMLGERLKKQGFTVLYTRLNDTFIPLEKRPALANEKKADLFISIHVNANTDPAMRGLETYYLGEAASKSAAKVASRENAVDVGKVSDVQFILTDLVLADKMKESRNLAATIHNGILAEAKAGKFSLPDHGVRSAMFYVLMGARMPAALLELSYVTNKDDAANLKSDRFLTRQCDGVVKGIVQFREDVRKQIR